MPRPGDARSKFDDKSLHDLLWAINITEILGFKMELEERTLFPRKKSVEVIPVESETTFIRAYTN